MGAGGGPTSVVRSSARGGFTAAGFDFGAIAGALTAGGFDFGAIGGALTAGGFDATGVGFVTAAGACACGAVAGRGIVCVTGTATGAADPAVRQRSYHE